MFVADSTGASGARCSESVSQKCDLLLLIFYVATRRTSTLLGFLFGGVLWLPVGGIPEDHSHAAIPI